MSIPNPGFPRPGVQYDFQNESQFRAAVQAVISALDAEIQGDTAILAEHDIVGANHTASGLTTGHVLQATGATTFAWQPLDFTDLGGSIADAQVPESAVTQHQAALSIAFTQLTGTIADAQVPETAVTQHQAALTILESQITDGSILARLAANETVSGLWDFSGIIDFGDGFTVSNGSNWYIDATQSNWIEINPTSDGSLVTGGWARYLGWNSGGGGTPAEVQMGVYGGVSTINFIYLTANATRGTNHYNLANTLRIKPGNPYWYDGTAERLLAYDDSASNFTMTGIWTFDRINVNADSYFYGTTTARYLWFDLGNGVTPQNGGLGWRDNGANEWLFRMDTGLNLEVYNYNVAAVVTQWDSATGDLRHSRDLYLEDSVTYPADGLLYVTSTGLVASSGASAQYDIPYNIDGSAWSYISKGASPDGYVIMLSSGIPTWSENIAAKADLLFNTGGGTYQDGDYYLALSNATGTLLVTQIELLPESNVIIGGASANTYRALTAADIGGGTFSGVFKFQYLEVERDTTPFYRLDNTNIGSPRTFQIALNTSGRFYIYDETAAATRFYIEPAGQVVITGDLYLNDSVTYPTDSLLYRTSTGQVVGTGAAATGDLLYNIDGDAWTSLPVSPNPDGYVLKLNGGLPSWQPNNAADADTLDGQHGAYYLALGNATGTLAVTKLQLLAESTVIIGGVSANETRALTGDDIDWSSAFGGASTQIYLDGASSSFRSSLGLYAAAVETNINFTAGYLRGGYVTTGATGSPGNYYYILSAGEDSRGVQIAAAYGGNDYAFFIRRGSDNAASENGANAWQNWKEIAVNGTDVNGFTFSGDPCLLLSHARPEIRFYETDGPTDEKYWRLYASGGAFSLLKMSDAATGTSTIWSITRSGTTADYSNWYIHDIRYSADGNDAQYHRWYANSNTGQTHLEFRRTFDSAMGWRITGQASTGDFYLSNYNFSSLQEHWIFGDASSGELTFDGQRITLTPQIRASATYDNGTIASGATLNVNWDNGNSQRCAANLGNITIAVNQATAYQGTSYTIEVTNIHSTTGRTVSWSGVSQWVGSAPTATVDAGKMTVVQIYVARNRAGSNYIIGSVILDNVTVPT